MLPFHLRRSKSFVVLFDDEPADNAIQFGPNNGDVSNGSVGDPHLRSVQEVVISFVLGFGHHVAGVGTVIGLGEAKTAHPFPRGQLRQIGFFLLFGTKIPNWIHGQRALDGCKRAKTAVATFQFLADEAVGHIGKSGASIAFQWCAKHTHFTESNTPFIWKDTFFTGMFNLRNDRFVNPCSNHVPDHDFFFGQQAFNIVKIESFERFHEAPSIPWPRGCFINMSLIVIESPMSFLSKADFSVLSLKPRTVHVNQSQNHAGN